ncbi:GNAT family N-acetyltransferase [Bacillus sp. FJAT-29937]|uniref:GNAT family N-acetyltransferase n=1 Tax=Bacillus sp. FJAT-29937 TaxID=1720553 RepID=UPI0009EC2902|nr:GNAT family protein [Bacillus sp. FJAT-29937]
MKNIQIENEIVCLKEMNLNDLNGIYEASQDELIWKHMTLQIATIDDAVEFVEKAISLKEQGTEYPFVIINQKTKQIIGSTRFLNLHLEHKRLEIGSTWLNPQYWRTKVNTNCKYLLLEYCFETLGLHRVQLKTDHENFRSQKAIERIGGKKEGILRNHMIRPDGTTRHTVMYSITHEEWPTVKEHLQQLLG